MKGYGIFVGVNKTSEGHYNSSRNFPGAKKNAEIMHDLAQKTKIYDDTKLLVDDKSTWDNLLKQISLLPSEDDGESRYLLISFSGFGINPHLNMPSDKKPDWLDPFQFLCFHDRMVSEVEIRQEISRFHKNYKVVLVMDACYSGGIAIGPYKKSMELDTNVKVKSLYEIYQNHKNKHLIRNEGLVLDPNYMAEVCFLGSSKSEQTSSFGNITNVSNYTMFLKAVWESKDFNGNYYDFNSALQEGHPYQHSPTIWTNPQRPNYFFRKTFPFFFTKIIEPRYMNWNVTVMEIQDKVSFKLELPSPYYFLLNSFIRERDKIGIEPIEQYIEALHLDIDLLIIVTTQLTDYQSNDLEWQIEEEIMNAKQNRQGKMMILIYDELHHVVLDHQLLKFNLN